MVKRQSRNFAKDNLPGKVYNRFKILLAEKEIEDNKRITHLSVKEEISRTTGIKIASSTLSAWANNEIERFDVVSIAVLCDYLNCGVGDLIVYKPHNLVD